MQPKEARLHVEWVLQRPFQNVSEWGWARKAINGARAKAWPRRPKSSRPHRPRFYDQNRGCTLADVEEEPKCLQRKFEQTSEEGRLRLLHKRPKKKMRRIAVLSEAPE
jgi:hypothetical protein